MLDLAIDFMVKFMILCIIWIHVTARGVQLHLKVSYTHIYDFKTDIQ
jgi:hypothetical protein